MLMSFQNRMMFMTKFTLFFDWKFFTFCEISKSFNNIDRKTISWCLGLVKGVNGLRRSIVEIILKSLQLIDVISS
jgi:hypothetical protein